ncbi:CRISPR-associated endonuclease Cas2 [candidate division KSB3 bacterium]|uniref:CRISPR-associated endoribonuclease Cas2 n=1 Tax=candidate division KSB3 bacterium TaxID=2044937 RepID=A0A2G6E5N0_9BACT|nr:MAG: CRISPR-associated endonuclease Cas2 [candidate division KSB3 bacterium]PIE29724.1 MAG: CRISPR-associated endonuclease Cas2 [candidate division KSB3 bacterium]
MYTIVSYDIQHDRRRGKLFKVLKDYGTWVQYSVFECDLSRKDFLKLRHRLKALLKDGDDDSVRFYPLCEDCRRSIERIGGVVPSDDMTVII